MADSWWAVNRQINATPPRTVWVTQQSATKPSGGSILTVSGPYKTEEEAQQFIDNNSGPHLNLPNPLHGVEEIGAVVQAGFNAVTDGKMWRSVGWIILGIVMLIIGIRIWMKKPIVPEAPDVVPVPV